MTTLNNVTSDKDTFVIFVTDNMNKCEITRNAPV